MTDRLYNDIASFLTPPPSRGVQFTQGRVLTWDNETLHNTIEWRGITLTDIPLVEGINALVIREGDIIGMLGWAPENANGVGSWWILGKLSNPGEFVADLNVTAKVFRFVTEDGNTLAFFGKDSNGNPLWILMYGGGDEQSAIRTIDAEGLVIHYRDGADAFRISGTTGNQIITMRDNSGNQLFATDAASEHGLARPWLGYRVVPSGPAQISGTSFWPSTPNGAYTQMMNGFNPVWHPEISVGVATATLGGGSADWQLRINGTTVHSASGSGSTQVTVPGWGTTVFPGDVGNFEIYGRISGGGTRAFFQCDRLYGRQS